MDAQQYKALREKMVEISSKQFICIVDESKLSKQLGPKFPLPVEITPFCYAHTIRKIEQLPALLGCKGILRRGNVGNNKCDGEEIAITDNGNYIVDLHLGAPIKIDEVITKISSIVGVLEHGLFIDMCSSIVVGTDEGVKLIKNNDMILVN